MKKLFILLISLSFALAGFSQNEPTGHQRSQRYRQIQSEKIAFFTAEIQLSPKEAEAFWPLYNEYWREREMLMRRTQESMKVITAYVKDGSPKTEPELVKLMEVFINNVAAEGSIHKTYFDRFFKILPVEKVARLYIAEEQFRMKMISLFRSGASPAVPINK
ncbi:MAG: hypothetical protein A2X17_09115 [Bacteroidetes bacterium GWF2_41_61]|jgi:hypothetical protein|nr:MAG: hypothetical protein A2X20_10470 [Bacteroidetes bacterium GWE2_40_15]OFY33065.1 MAG: hypothetical protein A2X17_09115 [Bacteroidetes bacterium GWF2_41_61]OFY89049.1 MAG: hypothetical protein A2266_08505 [Bacteroidetes bacterium RIFOXYA12_FULL_40_10]PKP07367.1 MAG: hypothetical protein CVU10_07450 [Bacteroidetes bacterium HGW-Bacteroidetes-5]HBG24239.1 hypothetical protein [Rikenellaceae bacterium]